MRSTSRWYTGRLGSRPRDSRSRAAKRAERRAICLGQPNPEPFSQDLAPTWRGVRKERGLLVRTVFSVVLGGGFGFAVYRLLGCRSGACPIWASPYVSTIYGALLGFLLSP